MGITDTASGQNFFILVFWLVIHFKLPLVPAFVLRNIILQTKMLSL